MQLFLKPALCFLFISILISACDSSVEKTDNEKTKTDTTAAIPAAQVITPKTTFKETLLNEKTVITGKKLSRSPGVNADAFKLLSVRSIDTTAGDENGFKYHLVDTLFTGNSIKIFLIGREYESENIIWIAVYDNNNKLLHHKTVYYDNAEGFLSVETTITNDQLFVTTFNDYAEKEKDKKLKEVYYLNENNKFVKIP